MENLFPKLIDRGRRSTWKKKGSKDIIERARTKVDQVLADYQPYELAKDVDTQLLALIKEIEHAPLNYIWMLKALVAVL
ncbi:MAG: trimethylamine methyltransferase family protein [Promethearchaeota archaeon]